MTGVHQAVRHRSGGNAARTGQLREPLAVKKAKMNLSPIKDLHRHCYDLSKVFGEIAPSYEWGFHSVQEWLLVASGVIGVDFDSTRFDTCWMYCSNIGEYEDKKTELLSALIHQLTTFNFIWASLEVLINLIDPEPVPKYKGKINATCSFLNKYYEHKSYVPRYKAVVSDLRDEISNSTYYKELKHEFKMRPHVGESGIGLYIVYKIRNHFAHGTLSLPVPDIDLAAQKDTTDFKIIHLSSTILLLTIQMLLLAMIKDQYAKVYFHNEEYELVETDLNHLLWHLHLQRQVDPNQMNFEFM